MILPSNIFMATCGGSMALYGSSEHKTTQNTIKIAIACLGLASAVSFLGLNPNFASATLLSINGERAITSISNTTSLLFDSQIKPKKSILLANITSIVSGVLGLAVHSTPLLGLSLAATITRIYLQSTNLSHFKKILIQPRSFIPLALSASILGAVAVGSSPLFIGAVAANLAWHAYTALVDLKCVPELV